MQHLGIANRHVGIGWSVRHAVAWEAIAYPKEILANSEFRRKHRTPLRWIYVVSKIALRKEAKRRRFVEADCRGLGQLGQLIEARCNRRVLCMVECWLLRCQWQATE